ncbi:MAG: hypothetical protein MI810_19480 [Flavobacteriales bacterium]|nr:hypothetical protein [Flavobacteriales bacterium]
MEETLSPVKVEKEAIASLSFKNHISFDQDPTLVEKLKSATKLGNLDKVKFHIDFYADSGLKSVQTTIWATGNKFICLKGGLWIPISKIVNIRFI